MLGCRRSAPPADTPSSPPQTSNDEASSADIERELIAVEDAVDVLQQAIQSQLRHTDAGGTGRFPEPPKPAPSAAPAEEPASADADGVSAIVPNDGLSESFTQNATSMIAAGMHSSRNFLHQKVRYRRSPADWPSLSHTHTPLAPLCRVKVSKLQSDLLAACSGDAYDFDAFKAGVERLHRAELLASVQQVRVA